MKVDAGQRLCESPGEIIRRLASFGCSHRPGDILLQQIERRGEKHHVLHEKRNIAGHRGKAAGDRIPAIRHERNDRDRHDESDNRTEGPQDPQLLVPESKKQQRAKRPFGNAQKPARPADAEHRIHPENQRAILNEWNQDLRLVGKPFLVAKSQNEEHHRGPDEMVVEVFGHKTRLRQRANDRIHNFYSFI